MRTFYLLSEEHIDQLSITLDQLEIVSNVVRHVTTVLVDFNQRFDDRNLRIFLCKNFKHVRFGWVLPLKHFSSEFTTFVVSFKCKPQLFVVSQVVFCLWSTYFFNLCLLLNLIWSLLISKRKIITMVRAVRRLNVDLTSALLWSYHCIFNYDWLKTELTG